MAKADRRFDGQIRVNTAYKALDQSSAPANPSSGTHTLYSKSDGWYELDSTGQTNPISIIWKVLTTGTTVAASKTGYILDGASAVVTLTIPAGTVGMNFKVIVHDITNVPLLDVDTNSQTVYYVATSFTSDQDFDVLGAEYNFVCIASNTWQMTAINPV